MFIMRFIFLAMAILGFSMAQAAALKVGDTFSTLKIDGEEGGLVAGGAWNGAEVMKGKMFTLFYVDPDEKETNLAFEKALHDEKFPRDKFGSMAVINMAATGMPNFLIEMKLKDKQKNYPDTVYVKDLQKILVQKWGLEDDSYVVIVGDKQGKILFKKAGKLSEAEIQEVLSLIKKGL